MVSADPERVRLGYQLVLASGLPPEKLKELTAEQIKRIAEEQFRKLFEFEEGE